MDAKFKVEKIEELLRETDDQEEGLDDEVKEERLGTFKRGDLYKMHTYRDALPAARSVWILYPGNAVKFYGKGGERAVPSEELPLVLDGVGAIPLLPDEAVHTELRKTLKLLLST
jgi:predicted component of viral defense system (DUF524 family)